MLSPLLIHLYMHEAHMPEPSSISVAIGWGAIVIPKVPRIQQIVIKESDRLRAPEADRAVKLILGSLPKDTSVQRMGLLTSFLVEMAERDPHGPMVGATALLISEELGRPYWWIEASKEVHGTSTSVFPLEANSVAEAVAAFRAGPTVKLLMTVKGILDLMQDLGKTE